MPLIDRQSLPNFKTCISNIPSLEVEEVAKKMRANDFEVSFLHGDMAQYAEIMQQFFTGSFRVLITT